MGTAKLFPSEQFSGLFFGSTALFIDFEQKSRLLGTNDERGFFVSGGGNHLHVFSIFFSGKRVQHVDQHGFLISESIWRRERGVDRSSGEV